MAPSTESDDESDAETQVCVKSKSVYRQLGALKSKTGVKIIRMFWPLGGSAAPQTGKNSSKVLHKIVIDQKKYTSFFSIRPVFVFRPWSVNHPVLRSAARVTLLLLRMKTTAGQWSVRESEDEDEDHELFKPDVT